MQDKEAVRLLKSGKVKGLEALIEKYAAYVSTVIRRIVLPALSESDIEELSADVFTAVWRNPNSVTADNIKSYLAAAARNKALSRLRTLKEWQPPDDEFLSVADVESEADKRLLAEALASALEELENSDREILVETYYYCRPLKETATKLEITENAAKTRLFRARSRLKKILTERGIVYED